MRRDSSYLFPLISIVLLFSTLSYGQAWSGILASSRAIDWTQAGLPATLPDGETTPNPWTPPTRTQCGSTLSPSGGDDTSAINGAVTACPVAHYVLLSPGTFSVGGKIALDGSKNVTLRGSGAQTTIVHMTSGGSMTIGDASGGGSATLTSGSSYTRGTISVIVAGSAPPVNQPAWFNQCDTGRSGPGCTNGSDADNGGLWICGEQTICSNQSANGSNHAHEQQYVFVTSVTGTGPYTVNFTPGLYMSNWAYASSPTISWNDPTFTAVGMGIEDLTIDSHSGTSNFGDFTINHAYASWVKGVRFIGPNADGCCTIHALDMDKVLFVNNAIYDSNPVSGVGGGLPFGPGHDSEVLIINNLIQAGGINAIEGGGFNSGVVMAYNYARDMTTSQEYDTDAEHSASPNFILREGNQFGGSEDDYTWGTHNLDTWFRNYYSCTDAPYLGLAAPRGIINDNFARFSNMIGNAIGEPGTCTTYQGSGSPAVFGMGQGDPLVPSTSMRWGNCDTVTDTCRFQSSEVPSSLPSPNGAFSNPVPGNNDLPCSFFLAGYSSSTCSPHSNGGTGLSWWQVCTVWATFPTSCATAVTQPFPAIGPDVSGGSYVNGTAYDIPAAVAYKNLPIDTSYQNSYVVTGSNWSSGTETLTVSGLPSSNAHIMGGFQLSGTPTTCLPTSGASYTGRADGELLMTGSSTTTISYALATNPNTSCAGTMKWPDIRQFDERVYENDPGTPPPAPPTGLNAQVD
jgi:hypothetical protein